MDTSIKKVSECGWIALFIIHEIRKGENSFWHPYLEMIREAPLDQPIFWEEQKLEMAHEIIQLLVERQKKEIQK